MVNVFNLVLLSLDDAMNLTTVGIGLVAVIVGFLLKWGSLEVYRKRVLRLEDEMLANHARILSLEKKNADLKTELQKFHKGGATKLEEKHAALRVS